MHLVQDQVGCRLGLINAKVKPQTTAGRDEERKETPKRRGRKKKRPKVQGSNSDGGGTIQTLPELPSWAAIVLYIVAWVAALPCKVAAGKYLHSSSSASPRSLQGCACACCAVLTIASSGGSQLGGSGKQTWQGGPYSHAVSKTTAATPVSPLTDLQGGELGDTVRYPRPRPRAPTILWPLAGLGAGPYPERALGVPCPNPWPHPLRALPA